MANLTPIEVLEPYRFFHLPVREFKPDGPSDGRIVCTRLEDNAEKPDALGDMGCTCVELVTETGRELLPRPIVRHSPTGFEWGYGGSGPADLAANCLAVVLPITEAWRLHQKFKSFQIAGLPREGSEFSIRSMRLWVQDYWTRECQDPEEQERERLLRADLALMAKCDELSEKEEITSEEMAELERLEQATRIEEAP